MFSFLYKQFGGNSYLEEKRYNPIYFNNGYNFPPCYDICGASRTIFKILKDKNLDKKYYYLLECHSLVLCQEVHIKNKSCNETMIDERLEDSKNLLKKYKDVKISKKIIEIVNKNTKDIGSYKLHKFLRNITFILENEIKSIMKDSILSKDEKNTILKMNNVFYQVHYPILSNKC